ncbi:MAG: metallophosphoesterase [Candidatus Melainabacteria bacterium]|nr:metallophosphoesterase [Candidatus Melainabacteria bacterium]
MITSLLEKITARLKAACSNDDLLFVVKPYLQLGDSADSLRVFWFSSYGKKHWMAQCRGSSGEPWTNLEISAKKEATAELKNVRKFSVSLPLVLPTIGVSEYQLLLDGVPVFSATYKTPSAPGCSKIVVFGDFGDGEQAAPALAAAVYERQPELILLAGDLVYDHGRISEYLNFFFPVLNADAIQKSIGAPLLRSILTIAAAGNHDVGMPTQNDKFDTKAFQDLFGFFLFWQGANNGPHLKKKTLKAMIGTKKKANKLLSDFGKSFFRLTNYSFNWSDQHWIILDANKYADWSLPELQEWLSNDLRVARGQKWKFVLFHQPGFNSDYKYFRDQRMRVICPILEAGGVDIVFSGHCHFYERHRPLYFKPDCDTALKDGTVPGQLIQDFRFDGVKSTHPQGIIYVVTGASGKVVGDGKNPNAESLSPSSAALIDTVHSFTELTFGQNHLVLQQISSEGVVIDCVRIDKN